MGLIDLGHEADPILTRIVEEDKVKWWKKPNLRLLYLLLYPTCMGIEITSGFDSQMINGLQFIPAWNKCESSGISSKLPELISIDFGEASVDPKGKVTYVIAGQLLGIISAAYNLGAILAVPVVPWVAQRYGRRWSIFLGSAFQCVGALIQCFSQHGMTFPLQKFNKAN